MAVPKPSIHGRDHRPGGADPLDWVTPLIGGSVIVPNVTPHRYVAYTWASDASSKLPGDGTRYNVPWGSDGGGVVYTNDVASLPGYGTEAGDSFPVIPASRSTPPGTGLWQGDYFEEFSSGVELAGGTGIGNTAVAPRSRATPGLYGLYLTSLRVFVDTVTPCRMTLTLWDHAADSGPFQPYDMNGELIPITLTSFEVSDALGRMQASQDSGAPADWSVSLWIIRMQATFGTPFTVRDAS